MGNEKEFKMVSKLEKAVQKVARLKELPQRFGTAIRVLFLADFLAIYVDKTGARSRSSITGTNPLVPLLILKASMRSADDLTRFIKGHIPQEYMDEFLAKQGDDKLQKLSDELYKGNI